MSVQPLQPKRPPSTRPGGAVVWLSVLVPLVVLEVWAVFRDVSWTLSETIAWVLGPAFEPRWWFLGMPLAALLLWAAPHLLFIDRIHGGHLLAAWGVSLVVALVGWLLTR